MGGDPLGDRLTDAGEQLGEPLLVDVEGLAAEDALELEERVQSYIEDEGYQLMVRVVWLTAPPPGLGERLDEAYDPFEQQEAILIEQYLGRYSLLMPVEVDMRNIRGSVS